MLTLVQKDEAIDFVAGCFKDHKNRNATVQSVDSRIIYSAYLVSQHVCRLQI